MRRPFRYAAVCKEARKYERELVEDPMTIAYGAPVDEIMGGYMARHIKTCEACRMASFEANTP